MVNPIRNPNTKSPEPYLCHKVAVARVMGVAAAVGKNNVSMPQRRTSKIEFPVSMSLEQLRVERGCKVLAECSLLETVETDVDSPTSARARAQTCEYKGVNEKVCTQRCECKGVNGA